MLEFLKNVLCKLGFCFHKKNQNHEEKKESPKNNSKNDQKKSEIDLENLKTLKKTELLDLAKKKKIDVKSSMRKDQIIEKIRKG